MDSVLNSLHTVSVLRGGHANSRESSLLTGKTVLSALSEKTDFDVRDILVDQDGWYENGRRYSQDHLLRSSDLVWNALHKDAQTGIVQKFLDSWHTHYTGSDAHSSRIASSNHGWRKVLRRHNIPHIRSWKFERTMKSGAVQSIFDELDFPVKVLSLPDHISADFFIAHSARDLLSVMEPTVRSGESCAVEAWPPSDGKVVSVLVFDDFRGQSTYVTLPIDRASSSEQYWYEDFQKSPESHKPANLSPTAIRETENVARAAHEALGLRHYSVIDLLVTRDDIPQIVAIDSHPRLAEHSVVATCLEPVGTSLQEFIHHIVEIARS